MQQEMFDVDDHLSDRLDAALAKFDCIIEDHILIIMGELDGFIDGPMYGALIFLRRAIAGPMGGDGDERAASPIGDYETATHETLEARLAGLATFLDADCPNYEADEHRSSPQGVSDWAGKQVGLAVVSLDIAVERLRADAVATGHGQDDPSAPTSAELMTESRVDAMARHRANRHRIRTAGANDTR